MAQPPVSALQPRPAVPLVLAPRHGWQPVALKELWHYRELLWIMALRDVRVRYKQTLLGVAWAVLQPFFSMVVFSIFFAGYGKLSTDGLPAPLFYFCGLLPWQLFANALTQAGNSLVGNESLLTKVYFPRLVIPIAAVITGLIDFALGFVLLLLMMAWYRFPLSPQILLLPLFLLLSLLAALAVGLWLSALNVEFRDFRYVIPFLTQFWFFLTPIVMPSSQFSPGLQWVLGLNPLSGAVEGFRWCMLGGPAPGPLLWVSVLAVVALLVGGLFYFRRMEKSFADLV